MGDRKRRHVAQASHPGALRGLVAHGDGALADVLRQIADALKIVGDAQHGDDGPQIDRHRLAQRDGFDRLFLDLPLHVVDDRVGSDDLVGEKKVAPRQRLHGVGYLLLRKAAHFGDFLGQLDQVGVEHFGWCDRKQS